MPKIMWSGMEMDKGRLMKAVRAGESPYRLAWILPLMLVLPIVVFWRPSFFFILDDWTALIQMAHETLWKYLNQSDGELWTAHRLHGLRLFSGDKNL